MGIPLRFLRQQVTLECILKYQAYYEYKDAASKPDFEPAVDVADVPLEVMQGMFNGDRSENI